MITGNLATAPQHAPGLMKFGSAGDGIFYGAAIFVILKAFASGVLFGGGGGSRMGIQPSVFTVNNPLSAVRFTTGKSVQFPM